MGVLRFIRKTTKYLLITAGVAALATKGSQYLPSLKGALTSEDPQGYEVEYMEQREVETSHLERFLPADRLGRPGQILYRKSYVVSYNRETKCPNWAFWELTREHADGDVKRPDYAFHEDMEVKAPRADAADYRGCGYDRGHMCPAGDNKWDREAMYETFLMTNICPQNQQLNSGLWNQIEQQCRYWAKKHGRLYVACGPLFLKGDHHTIGPNRVMVPDAFFKVVLCLEGTPKGIAFICRNTEGDRPRDYYVNTIRDVERVTGYTFFPNLTDAAMRRVKEEADLEMW